MRDRFYDLCGQICMAVASAAALGYISAPWLWLPLQFALWSSIAFSIALSLLLIVGAMVRILELLLKLTESPKERNFRVAREAGEKRFREVFGNRR